MNESTNSPSGNPPPAPAARASLHPLVAVASIAVIAVCAGAAVVYIAPRIRHAGTTSPAGAAASRMVPGYAPAGERPPSAFSAPPAMGAAACPDCGVVAGIRRMQAAGHDSGLGAVAGGLLGGVLGNQVGGGNGKTAMTVVGALGGALAGNEVEKRERTTTEYLIDIRMENGSTRTIRGSTPPNFGVGTPVRVQGDTIMPR